MSEARDFREHSPFPQRDIDDIAGPTFLSEDEGGLETPRPELVNFCPMPILTRYHL